MYLKWNNNPQYNPTVKEIQRMLNRAYIRTRSDVRDSSWLPLKEDGYFGKSTAAAVWAFQKSRKLIAPEYGVVGDDTWRALCDFYEGPMIVASSERTIMDKFRTQILIWHEEYPESCKNAFINNLSNVLNSIGNLEWLKNCISKKQWKEIADRYNTSLYNSEVNHNRELRELERELRENQIRHENAVNEQHELTRKKKNGNISGKEYNETKKILRKERNDANDFRNSKSLEAQNIRKSIKAKHNLSPEEFMLKIKGVTKGIANGLSYIEAVRYGWKLFLHHSVPLECRDSKWHNENNHIIGQLIDSIINILVGQLLAIMVTAAVGATVLTGGWAIAAVIIIGALISWLIDYIFDLIDLHFFNKKGLTGLERYQMMKKNSQIYVDWAQSANITV